MGMLKSHQSPGDPTSAASVASSSVEQERYLSALVAATPLSLASSRGSHLADSSLSIESLLLAAAAAEELGGSTLTPEVARRSNPFFNKAMGTLGKYKRKMKLLLIFFKN